MAISRNSAILDSAILDLDFKMGWKLGLIKSSSWVELRLHTENQLTRCPGYGFILVRVSYLLFVIICYFICYRGKVTSTKLSWVGFGSGWVGLEFDNKKCEQVTAINNNYNVIKY